MIRFVDFGDQILEGTREFGFYDTITDTFVFAEGHAFTSWQEFEIYFEPTPMHTLARFKSLCPPWVFDPSDVETPSE